MSGWKMMKLDVDVKYITEDFLMRIPKIELVKMFLGLTETPEVVIPEPAKEYRLSKDRLESMMLKVDTPWGNDKSACPYIGVEYVRESDAYKTVFDNKQIARRKDPVAAAVEYDKHCDNLGEENGLERNRDVFDEVKNYEGE